MKKAVVLALILGLVIGVPLFNKYGRGEQGKTVEVAKVEQRLIRSSVLASGSLTFRDRVELRSELIGKVSEVLVEEAQRVKQGDIVLRIDPEQFAAEVEQNEANRRMQAIAIERQQLMIQNLEKQYARKQGLFQRGLLDENSYDEATNELQIAKVDLQSREQALSQAEALLAQATDRLNKTIVRAPLDGIVTSVNVKAGETVIAGTTNIAGSVMMTIADPSEILAEINVDEADIARISQGLEADIFAVAFPNQPFQGVVESIATSAKPPEMGNQQQGLSFLVKVLLGNTHAAAIRTGMSCRAEIHTQGSEASLAVPIQAVLYDNSEEAAARNGGVPESYVFLAIDGAAVKRVVKLGLADDSHQAILEGQLASGDQVITGPYRVLRFLAPGEAIVPTEPETALAGAGGR